MRTRRTIAFPLAALVLLLALATTGGAAPSGDRELTVLVPAEFPTLDTHETVSGDQSTVQYHVFSRLYTLDERMKPQPDLFTSESLSKDGTTWTYELRPNVVFHDGTPLNAEAVKYSYERMMKSKGSQRALFALIKEVRAESPTRLVLVTSAPSPSLRNNLGHAASGIVSPAADRRLGDGFGLRPVGAGPYRLQEWVKGSHILLARHDRYYGARPYFDRILFKFVTDATTRTLLINTGQADVALRVQPIDIPRLQANRGLRVGRISGRNIFFQLKTSKGPFSDVKVRWAANHAVDKQAIIERVLFGAGEPARSLVESVDGSTPVGFYQYDVERAKTLLRQAGAEGAKVLLLSPTTRYQSDAEVSQAVAGYLRQAGFDVQVRVLGDWPAYVAAVTRGEFDLYMLGWGGSTGDPDNPFRRLFHTSVAGKLWNVGGYRNAQIDRLIEQGGSEFDPSRRAKIYADLQRTVWREAPWLFLYRLSTFIVSKAEIQGIKVLPGTEMPYFWLAQR
ncbi:MAG: hypothetical protein HY660_10045 [Armatimonadetes bacterium]|nr:hypothetical protein [Armatimonadota bacterium]